MGKHFPGATSPRFDPEREEMIELIRSRGVADERLLKALRTVDRRAFVQDPFRTRAYEDSALPIGCSQTISQPYTLAVMTEALGIGPGSRVLEVGTGSGYQAAVLAEMGARVFTIERHMELLEGARRRLEKLGYQVASKCGDGTIGWREFAPYDGIIVTAGAPEVPRPLCEQLADGGILVIPIGDLDIQSLTIVRRVKEDFEQREAGGFKFVPLIGKKGWKQNGPAVA